MCPRVGYKQASVLYTHDVVILTDEMSGNRTSKPAAGVGQLGRCSAVLPGHVQVGGGGEDFTAN